MSERRADCAVGELSVSGRLCSHLTILNRGTVVAAGSMEEMRAGFGGRGLEEGFMQLTEQVDADRIAQDIVAAAAA